MNEVQTVQLIALVGWLVLMIGAFASYRLDWAKGIKMALVWLAIFLGVFVLFTLVRGG